MDCDCGTRVGRWLDVLESWQAELVSGPQTIWVLLDQALRRGLTLSDAHHLLGQLAGMRDVRVTDGPGGPVFTTGPAPVRV